MLVRTAYDTDPEVCKIPGHIASSAARVSDWDMSSENRVIDGRLEHNGVRSDKDDAHIRVRTVECRNRYPGIFGTRKCLKRSMGNVSEESKIPK
jgi:hypothetical protein